MTILRNTTSPYGRTVAKNPKRKVRPGQPGKNSEFKPITEDDIFKTFPEFHKEEDFISSKAIVMQIVHSSVGSTAEMISDRTA